MFNPFSLEGKTILVTGASSGIGRGIAIASANAGANVILTARNSDRLREVYSLLSGKNHRIIVADLTCSNELDALINNINIKIDGVVCSAGISDITLLKQINQKKILSVFNINVFSQILLISNLLKQKKINDSASFVFISSISGTLVGSTGEILYSASKGAINGYIKSAAIELAHKGYRINSISPGIVETNLLKVFNGLVPEDSLAIMKKNYPLKRFGKPEDIAYGAIYLLSNASSWVTGTNLVIDGGYTIK